MNERIGNRRWVYWNRRGILGRWKIDQRNRRRIEDRGKEDEG
jgi:hypothetical protein